MYGIIKQISIHTLKASFNLIIPIIYLKIPINDTRILQINNLTIL